MHQEGDTIAISSPCFHRILELLGKMSRKIIEIPSLDDGRPTTVRNTSESKRVDAAIFCTSHMNPHGSICLPVKSRNCALANEHRVPIIEDDVYLELSILRTPTACQIL
ncbi:hypothetical protein OK016_17415 [Vibrio chagasii]|nr:hypothetical protein [Vibrio chagasii]